MKKEGSFGQNAVLSVIPWVVSGIAAFVCVPITIRGLGPDAYGLMALVSALTGYLGLIDMGLGQAIVRYLSYFRALGEGRPMIAIVRVALTWFAAAGCVGGLFLFLSASWLASDLLQVPPDLMVSAVMVIRLSAVNLVLGLVLSVGTAIPISFLRFDIAAGMSGAFSTLYWIGPAAVVTLGYGIVAITLFYIASNALALVLYFYFGWRLFRAVSLDAGPEWREIRRMVLSFAGLVGANRIGSTLAAQTNRLMVGMTAGTAAAAYYQVPSVLASKATELLNRIAGVLFPTGSALIARGDYEGLRALYFKSSRYLFLLNASMAMPIAVYARPLLGFWVSPLYAEKGSQALVIFAATLALNTAALPVGYLSWSAARAGTNLLFASLSSAISLAAVYPLTSRFGVTGAATAGLLGALVQPFFIHYVDRRILEVSSVAVFRRCHLPTLVGASVAGLASGLILLPHADSLALTVALLLVTGMLSVVISASLGAVSRQEVRQFRSFLAGIRPRFGS
jgi:O-antigen/teichoic acid export membrane protein